MRRCAEHAPGAAVRDDGAGSGEQIGLRDEPFDADVGRYGAEGRRVDANGSEHIAQGNVTLPLSCEVMMGCTTVITTQAGRAGSRGSC